jgi:hypothetical protein
MIQSDQCLKDGTLLYVIHILVKRWQNHIKIYFQHFLLLILDTEACGVSVNLYERAWQF